MTDRTMIRNAGNPDAVAAVPDSQIHTYASDTHWDVHRNAWVTYNPQTHTYEAKP